jgi:hypothetical protein
MDLNPRESKTIGFRQLSRQSTLNNRCEIVVSPDPKLAKTPEKIITISKLKEVMLWFKTN